MAAEDIKFKVTGKFAVDGESEVRQSFAQVAESLTKVETSGKVTAKQLASIRVAMDEAAKSADKTAAEMHALAASEESFKKLSGRMELQRTALFNLNDETKEAVTRNRGLKESLFDGATGMERMKNATTAVGGALATGFAVGVGIAKAAGVDFTESLNVMKSAAEKFGRAINSAVVGGLEMIVGPVAKLAKLVGLDGLAADLEDAKLGLVGMAEATYAVADAHKNDAEKLKQLEAAEKARAEAARKALEEAKRAAAERKRLLEEEVRTFERSMQQQADIMKRMFLDVQRAARERYAEEYRLEKEMRAWELEGAKERKQLAAEADAIATARFEKEMAARQAAENLKIQQDQATIDRQVTMANAVVGLASQAFGNTKEVAIAQAIINTYEGATKAYAQGGIYGAALAAIVVAAGMMQVQKIASTEAPEGGEASAPSFDDPANDAMARMAGRSSARDFVSHYNGGFRDIMTGAAPAGRDGVTSRATSLPMGGRGGGGGGTTTINVVAAPMTSSHDTAKAVYRQLRKTHDVVIRKNVGNRTRPKL